MEEADALADRAGIMAKRMLAMGTSDYLRRKHGDCYYLHLVMKSAPHTTDDEISTLRSWVLKRFPGADIEDKTYHGQIRFSVPASRDPIKHEAAITITATHDGDDDAISGGGESRIYQEHWEEKEKDRGNGIGALITVLEDHREELGLEHYSVSPTTLDQVFLTIVEMHNVEEEGYVAPKKKRAWGVWKGWKGRKEES
jgi:ATP-binding cassette subfamily A (ABC1) protein 3